ncbi:MAG: MarR family transcriptional regulator [Rhodanobacter sp.]
MEIPIIGNSMYCSPMNDLRLNEELIDCLFAIRIQIHTELKELARDAGLTDTQTDVLWRLSRESEMTARRLADLLQCDASTATSMIDRLEKRGLVRRIPHPNDRRAKLIQLTPAGCELRDRVIQQTSEHSPFGRLDRASRLRLHALLRDVVDGASPQGGIAPVTNEHDKDQP